MSGPLHDFANLPTRLEPAARELARAYLSRQRGAILLHAPGLGGGMLARRVQTLARLTEHQRRWIAIEHACLIHAGIGDHRVGSGDPFRAPHHTVSADAMTGKWSRAHLPQCLTPRTPRCVCGLSPPTRDGGVRVSRAGECDLARFGVIHLSEITEFRRSVLEATAHRLTAMGETAPFIVATDKPCLCGYGAPAPAGSTWWPPCTCSPEALAMYRQRVQRHAAILGIPWAPITLESPERGEYTNPGPRCASSATIRRETVADLQRVALRVDAVSA